MRARIVLSILLVASCLPWPASALHTAPTPDVLYLAQDPGGGRAHNFTTHAPDPSAQGAALAMLTELNFSTIDWSMQYLPADWTIGTGDQASLEIWIEGLDRVVAVADPLSTTEKPGQVTVRAELFHGGSLQAFASGDTGVATDATAPGSDPTEVKVALDVAREVTFTNDSATGETLRLVVTVFGHNRPESPLQAHVLDAATPSRLIVEGFPVTAFRAWEDAERAEAECNARALEGGTCESPTPTNETVSTPSGGAGIPWIAVLGALGVLMLVLLVLTRRR